MDGFVVKDEADFCVAFKFNLGGTEVGAEVLVAGGKGEFEGGGEGVGGGRGGNGSSGMRCSSFVTERDKGGGKTSRKKQNSEKERGRT